MAREMYGVVIINDKVDEDATAKQRERIRNRRLSEAGNGKAAPVSSEGLTPELQVGQHLNLLGKDSEKYLGCSCGRVLSPALENYKEWVAEARRPLSAGGAQCDPFKKGHDRFELREYYCPGCAVLLEVDMVEKSEPLVWDLELT